MLSKYKIGPSSIHGYGVIATGHIANGEIIGVAVVINGNLPTITEHLGQYVNHSLKANSKLKLSDKKYDLVAIKDIQPGEEIVANYNEAPYFISKPEEGYK